MVDLFATHKIIDIHAEVKDFLEKEIYPAEQKLLNQPFSETEKFLQKKRGRVKEMGYWAPQLPADHGGWGLSLTEFAILSELLGTTPFGHYLFNCQAPDSGNMELLMHYGSESVKSKFLEPLIHGEIRSCFSMTEPDFAGSNPVLMGTTALIEGNEYVINGRKWFTSSADGAAFAIVMAQTDPDSANPYARASMIIVPTDSPGFKLIRNIPVMGEAGEGYFSHAEIQYENCRVPVENLVGDQGSGFLLAQERLGPGRIHHCMRWIGICERSLDLMCRRAASREIAPGRMLGSKQTIQNWIAESRAEIDAARLMVLHTAHQMDKEGTKAAREAISTIKFFVANVLEKVVDRAIQVHGALGITDDTPLAYWYRHERGARIYDGPDEVHKSVLARRILKKYGLNL
jgi:alkylation response protein AidB-like acyl-CoA dehydrogenase